MPSACPGSVGGRCACGAPPGGTCWCPDPGRQLAHLLQLRLRGHLLRDERGLDAVEQPFEPADELGLGDAELGVGGRLVLEGQGDSLELLDELGSQTVLELGERALVDLGEPRASLVVERRAADLLEELLDHRPDPHDLGRLLDEVGGVGLATPCVLPRVRRPSVPSP